MNMKLNLGMSEILSEFRTQLAIHKAMATPDNDDEDLVERTYGPWLCALMQAPPVKTKEEACDALLLLLEGRLDELERALGSSILAFLQAK